jgi:glutathione S-transferase
MKATGIDFVEHSVKLFTDQWRAEIAALSPSQLVPVLKGWSSRGL